MWMHFVTSSFFFSFWCVCDSVGSICFLPPGLLVYFSDVVKASICDTSVILRRYCCFFFMSSGTLLRDFYKFGWHPSASICICFQQSESRSVISNSLRPHRLYSPWNSPGQNTGVGSHSLLLGIFPTQGLNPGLPRCRWILHQLSHKGSPASNKHTWNPDLTSGGYFLLYVFLSLSLPSLKFTLLNSTILHMKISRGKENTDLWCSFLKTTCPDLSLQFS